MATSILDYIFRELAISYLDRSDLAHVEPADLMPDTVGKQSPAGPNLREAGGAGAEVAAMMQKVASSGYVRNKLTVLPGGGGRRAQARNEAAGQMPLFDGPLAVAAEAPESAAQSERIERIRAARIKGYEGDSCDECGNFTLVRNGTCLKCDTCGSTSGCS
jgi:ribonucleoside-diphosphate reductase alpha chain